MPHVVILRRAQLQQALQADQRQQAVAQAQDRGAINALDLVFAVVGGAHQLNDADLRHRKAFGCAFHDQRRHNRQRQRDLDGEGGAAAFDRPHLDGATDLFDVGLHHVHAHEINLIFANYSEQIIYVTRAAILARTYSSKSKDRRSRFYQLLNQNHDEKNDLILSWPLHQLYLNQKHGAKNDHIVEVSGITKDNEIQQLFHFPPFQEWLKGENE